MVTSGKLFAPSTTVAGLQLVSELCTSCNSSLSVKRNLRFSTQLLLNSRKFYEKPAGVRRGLSGYQELESRKYSQRLGSLEAISVNKHSLLESVQPTTRVRVTIATSAMQEDGFEGRGDDGSWDSEPGSRFAEGTQRKFSSRGNNGQFGQRRPNSSSNGSEFRSSDRSERGRGVEARQFPSKGPGGRSSSLRGRDETRSFGGRGDLARKSEPERRGGEGRSRGRGIAANGKDVQFRRVASNADDENVQDNKVSVDHRRERTKSKHPAVREQVSFVEPMSSDPNIAIIGGGISGIVCALTLAERGIRSTLFDTGKHGLGGRMATRHVEYRGDAVMTFDHAAQFFTVSDPRFQRLVDRWQEDGLVKEWKGVIGTIQAGGSFVELPLERRYVGIGGMRALCDRLAEQV